MSSPQVIKSLQEATWRGSLPLEILLAPSDSRLYDQTDPYYVHFPRLSYLPFLLERLHAFFNNVLIDPDVSPSAAWFSYEGVPLKWHHPVGLLYDLFSGNAPATASLSSTALGSSTSPARKSSVLPWRLRIHYSSFPAEALIPLDSGGKAMHDAFINSVKEADFLRNGTANAIMKLNIEHSNALWDGVMNNNLAIYAPIYNRLLPERPSLRHIPVRVYLPASDVATNAMIAAVPARSRSPLQEPGLGSSPSKEVVSPSKTQHTPAAGHLRVVQSLIQPSLPGTREVQTLGTALNVMLPALFPSRRRMVLARPVLHGAVVPLESVLEDLMRGAAYADGWLSLGIDMII